MQRITPGHPWPLHDTEASRRAERHALDRAADGALMQRAGLAVARLAAAVAPHARTVWIACGPGNNGGDGFEAALHLQRRGCEVHLTAVAATGQAPADACAARARAEAAGLTMTPEPPPAFDLAIDALFGLGLRRPPEGDAARWIERMNAGGAPVLAVDLPSGLDAGTGMPVAPGAPVVQATHTLALLTLKPGLFTGHGRDCAGEIWLDALDADTAGAPASAQLTAAPCSAARPHASHKGSFGDVAVIGGAPGMAGAALMAARSALHAGAGRVFAGLLDPGLAVDAAQPELMLRPHESLQPAGLTAVAGCGGGDAIRKTLPRWLSGARALVLDADALNAIAADPMLADLLAARGRRGQPTVLTPHPLEAARLLGCSTAQVQANRVAAALELARRHGVVVVLKGSGTVIAAPGEVPRINSTGNARLATAGTGDVLAGLVGARLAAGQSALDAACDAVYLHGEAADRWDAEGPALTASRLARAIRR